MAKNVLEAGNELMGVITNNMQDMLEEMRGIKDRLDVIADRDDYVSITEALRLCDRAKALKEISDFYKVVLDAINNEVSKTTGEEISLPIITAMLGLL